MNKNTILFFNAITLIFLVFFVLLFLTDNCTGRKFEDGIKKAEMHHILTGKYYNKYKILDNDSTYILIEHEQSFEYLYQNKLKANVLEK